MSRPVEITDEELALILEALDDAAFYRDARSRVLESAVRRKDRGSGRVASSSTDRQSHQLKVQAYQALAVQLRRRQTED